MYMLQRKGKTERQMATSKRDDVARTRAEGELKASCRLLTFDCLPASASADSIWKQYNLTVPSTGFLSKTVRRRSLFAPTAYLSPRFSFSSWATVALMMAICHCTAKYFYFCHLSQNICFCYCILFVILLNLGILYRRVILYRESFDK